MRIFPLSDHDGKFPLNDFHSFWEKKKKILLSVCYFYENDNHIASASGDVNDSENYDGIVGAEYYNGTVRDWKLWWCQKLW